MVTPNARVLSAALLLFAASGVKAAGPAQVSPESVKAVLPELDRLIEQTMKKTGVPGVAVAVVCKGQVLSLKGFGVREAGKDGRVDGETVFQLASVSKPMTATVLAALIGDGKLHWDDRVLDHDPAFQLIDPFVTRELTIRDLLCHRSGLPDHAGDLLEDLGYDRAEVLRRLRFQILTGSFRGEYAYTNFGFTEAAVAGARAVGKTWEDVADEKLFRPLGMTASSYRFADYAKAENRARLHVRDGSQWVARHTRQPDAQAPAGGASSSAHDLSIWLRLLLAGGTFDGKPVVASKALAETFRPQIINHMPADSSRDRAAFYGLGWNVSYDADGGIRLGHSGGFDLGAATAIALRPAEGLGIVVVTNGQPIGVPEAVCASFLDLALKGKVRKNWLESFEPIFAEMSRPPYGTTTDYAKSPAETSPPASNQTYLGTYHNDYFGDLQVAKGEEGLLLRLGPKPKSYALRHWNRDVFAYQPDGEMAAGLSAVTFWVGPGQKAARVILENLDLHGQGTFVRLEATE